MRKSLVRPEALKPVSQAATAARQAFYGATLPWSDQGQRVLPAQAYLEFSALMAARKADFEQAAREFLSDLGGHYQRGAAALGALYSPEDYPDESAIREKFRFEVEITPIPSSADFRCSLSDADRDALARQLEARHAARMADAVRDIYSRLLKPLREAAEKLAKFDPAGKGAARGTFRDSLIENIREIAGTVPRLLLAPDPALEAVAAGLLATLDGITADDCRTREETREHIADAATQAAEALEKSLSDMGGYFGAPQ